MERNLSAELWQWFTESLFQTSPCMHGDTCKCSEPYHHGTFKCSNRVQSNFGAVAEVRGHGMEHGCWYRYKLVQTGSQKPIGGTGF